MDTSDKIKQCQELLSKAPGMKLKGNHYTAVKDRIRIFREVFGLEYDMETDYVYKENSIVCKSWLSLDGKIKAVGLSEQFKDSRSNKVMEMAQTVSLGRMLSSLGMDGGEFASADEIQEFIKDNETSQQESGTQSETKQSESPQKIVPLSAKQEELIIKLFSNAQHLGDIEAVFTKHRDQIINNEKLTQLYQTKKEGINDIWW